ncbi:HTH-type transcriptional regulator PgrR [Halomonadaceae bacterium LMG 33818]|uniref:LysR family transcriptional regulator n=1 Tax=Cernens ardua TaxID=3402176 RepID=UPI003EDBB6A0
MKRHTIADLQAFMAISEAGSFTRAAAQLGTSQSALSHTLRRLEEELDVRLMTRTTRNISLTQAGQRLLNEIKPAFQNISHSLKRLDEFTQQPSGHLRITSSFSAARQYLLPVADQLMQQYPDLNIELSVENRLVNIVEERFDAGVRLGEQIEKDMIAVPISGDVSMAVVGSAAYFKKYGYPQRPSDLPQHRCLNIRFQSSGGIYVWELERDGRPINIRTEQHFVSDNDQLILDAALRGMGLACVPDNLVMTHIQEGRLVRILEPWCPPFPGYHLYYPDRRRNSLAFNLFVDALRSQRERT